MLSQKDRGGKIQPLALPAFSIRHPIPDLRFEWEQRSPGLRHPRLCHHRQSLFASRTPSRIVRKPAPAECRSFAPFDCDRATAGRGRSAESRAMPLFFCRRHEHLPDRFSHPASVADPATTPPHSCQPALPPHRLPNEHADENHQIRSQVRPCQVGQTKKIPAGLDWEWSRQSLRATRS
jgi:hypothetical protein